MPPDSVSMFQVTGWPALLILLGLGFLAYGWPAMIVARRAGRSRWVGLLMSVPVVNIVVIWAFAFSTWTVAARDTAR